MTDPVDDRERERRAAEHALAVLEGAEPEAGESAAEERAYTELLGVLPHELEPVAPSPEVRDRLLAAVRGGAAATGAGSDPAAGTLPFRRAEAGAGPGTARRSSGPPWALPLAAALAALAFGLSGWLGARVAEQQSTIADLTRELSAAGEQAERLERANADLASAREQLRSRLALATSLGMVACPLKPMDDDHPEVRGLLFMSPDGGPWLVSVHDLEPPPDGSSYVLWFLGRNDEHRRAGVLAPGPDRAAQMSAEAMPGHEGMTGVAVTLEANPQAESPTGPMMLFGDERISII